jgi:cytoskeletal protein RodZ
LFGVVVVVAMVWWIASSGDDADDHIPQVTGAVESEAEPIQDSVVEASRPDFDFVLQGDPIVVTTDIAVQSIENLDAAEPVFNEPEAGDIETSAAVLDSTLDRQVTETQGQLDETSGPIENDIRVERSQDGDVTYITVNANGFDEVEATFLDDCWLEVEDGNGDSIYGDLNKSGEVLRIYGVAPFQLLIGRASALNLTFNGDVVDLARFASTDETAKVTLTRQR